MPLFQQTDYEQGMVIFDGPPNSWPSYRTVACFMSINLQTPLVCMLEVEEQTKQGQATSRKQNTQPQQTPPCCFLRLAACSL